MPSGPLYKYTPGQAPPEELEATFVARQGLLQQLMGRVHEWAGGAAPEHTLILGSRGLGKTHLLRLLANKLRAASDLTNLHVVVFPEESYAVGSIDDLLAQVWQRLPGLVANADAPSTAEQILDRLRRLATDEGARILLLIDSFDLLLDQLRVSDEAHLHRLLTDENYLGLVGAAPQAPPAVTDHGRPLFHMFRLERLRPLEPEQADEMLRRRAEWASDEAIIERWGELTPRIRAISEITGGNPRLLLMLYQSLQLGELPTVVQAFRALLDELTPFYKHIVENRSPQQRKVLVLAAFHNRGASPSKLAAESGLPERQVAAVLGDLVKANLLKRVHRPGSRTSAYPFTEPLLRMWLQLRSSPEGERYVTSIVEFFRLWYSADEAEYLRVFTAELERAVEQSRGGAHEGADNERLMSLTYLALAAPSTGTSLAAVYRLASLPDDLIGSPRLIEAYDSATHRFAALEPGNAYALLLRGVALAEQERRADAVTYFERALEVADRSGGDAWAAAIALFNLRRYAEALSILNHAVHAAPSPDRLILRAEVLVAQGRLEEALADLLRLADLSEESRCVPPESTDEVVRLLALIALASSGRERHLARRTLDVLTRLLPGISPDSAITAAFRHLVAILRTGDLQLFREGIHQLETLREPVLLLEPFHQTLAYVESGQNPYQLEALNPDVRRAVELLASQFGSGANTAQANAPK